MHHDRTPIPSPVGLFGLEISFRDSREGFPRRLSWPTLAKAARIGKICLFRWGTRPAHPPTLNRRPVVEEYDRLKQAVHEIEEDLRKAEGGNKAAGTRVRKAMQDIKNLAQDIRKKVLEFRPE